MRKFTEKDDLMFNTKRIFMIFGLVLLIGLTACGRASYNQEVSYRIIPLPPYVPEGDAPDVPDWGNYPVIINGAGYELGVFTAEGELFPTHVSLSAANALGLTVMAGGSQILIERDNGASVELNTINYLAGMDGFDIGLHDTFMSDDFHTYVPISIFRELGFGVNLAVERVFIYEDVGDMH